MMIETAPLMIGRRLSRTALCAVLTLPALVAAPIPQVSANDGLVLAQAIPLPRPNPKRVPSDPIADLISGGGVADQTATSENAPPAKATPVAAKPNDLPAAGFTMAAELLRKGDPAAATMAAYALSDRESAKLIDWLIATSGDESVPSQRIAQIAAALKGWPGDSLMQLRLEQALFREEASDAAIRDALDGRSPETEKAMLAVARAHLASGNKAAAQALIRDAWRNRALETSTEKAIGSDFKGLLRASDHKYRMDRLLYAGQHEAGVRASKFLDGEQRKIAAAVSATIRRRSNAASLLTNLSKKAKADPLVIYARVKYRRRDDRPEDAAKMLATAPRDRAALVDPDAWWVERRFISRTLAEEGKHRLAYEVAANHLSESSGRIADAEFHAGWFALEFLGDPAKALPHFQKIEDIASRPLSLSRAAYWTGRAHKRAGRQGEAETHFRKAAGYPFTFYGQLSLAGLGADSVNISIAPQPTGAAKARFEDREYVKVVRRLLAANLADRAPTFLRALARQLDDPAEIRLLSDLAQSADLYQTALQIGIIASGRGLPVDDLAFRTEAIPASAKTSSMEKSVVYAIARQESKFNREAISRVGARGLMQLMPATAKETAGFLGLPYSRSRLTSDPAYNATLGAAYLRRMMDRFDGSYIMTFAAYNAGGSRVDAWIKRFGDPRSSKVDVVNWIESIPFSETRNYVQRTMENLQVYRTRFGSNDLTITRDLRRHGSS